MRKKIFALVLTALLSLSLGLSACTSSCNDQPLPDTGGNTTQGGNNGGTTGVGDGTNPGGNGGEQGGTTTPDPDEGEQGGTTTPDPDEGEQGGTTIPDPDEGEQGGTTTPDPDEGEQGGTTTPDPDEGEQGGTTTPDPDEGEEGGTTTPDPDEGEQGGTTTPDPDEGEQGGTTTPDPDEGEQGGTTTPDPDEGEQGGTTTPDPDEGEQGGTTTPDPDEGEEGGTITPDPDEGEQGGTTTPDPDEGEQGGTTTPDPDEGEQGGTTTPDPDEGEQGGTTTPDPDPDPQPDPNPGGSTGGGTGSGSQGGGSTGGSHQTITVTYMDGETVLAVKQLSNGSLDEQPTVTKAGYYLAGWYTDPEFSGEAYDFTVAFTEDTVLYARWVKLDSSITYTYAGNESAAFEWNETNPAGATVEYRLSGQSSYTAVDDMLIRAIDGDTARVDVIGLRGNCSYDFKITSSAGAVMNVSGVHISAYDRSGYAHFNYTQGVGAYNDDGTIKDNTLVIYLTDDNKNNLANAAFVDGQPVDISGYFKPGTPMSIGYLLNNRQYSNSEREEYGIQALCFDYGAVVVRVIGTVNAEDSSDCTNSLIEGLTAYNSTDYGGSKGDNGRMARMLNAKNLTIEGVGTDACIYGWGLHFVSNDNLHKYDGAGTSFEVRNITFENYPEDAIGMEGTQGTKVDANGSITSDDDSASADLISPVERCWIHHNTFLPGYCAKPAESDKAEGDGSCDFKRGQYYTASYNYFEYCHKTNLIGSGDTSLSYNISLHHNWWNNCGSRMPLARRANIHFYNNYISGDNSDPDASLSYVTSARANTYIFQEANYYDGCKSVVELASGGAVKAYNNVYYACFNGDESTHVTSREEKVANSCQFIYRNIDYSSFDTNPSQFYYDEENNRSNCYLTSAEQAREDAIKYAGVLKYDYNIDTSMNKYTPSSAISYPSGSDTLAVDLYEVSKGSSVVSGVQFNGITGTSSGTVKGKGQIITFTLLGDTEVSITATASSADYYPELVSADGTVWAGKFTSVNLTLPAGTYFIASGSKDKESTISALSFKEGATAEEKVAAVIAAIDKIPASVTLEQSCVDVVNAAAVQYNSLSADLKGKVTNAAKLTNALSTLNDLRVSNVISLIDRIGNVSVTNDYLDEITAARSAYDALSAENKAKVTNYSKLTAAEAAYKNIAVDALNNRIANLASPSTATNRAQIESLTAQYQAVVSSYGELEDSQKASVVGYKAVLDGLETLAKMYQPYQLINMIDALPDSGWTSSDNSAIGAAKALYNSLDDSQKAVLSPAQISKLESAIAYYDEQQAKTVVILFQKSNPQSYYSELGVTIENGNYKSGEEYTYDGETYSDPLKIESKTEVTITVGEGKTVYLQLSKSGKIKIDGVDYQSDSNGLVTVTGLSEGTHTITKNTSLNLWYIVMN